MTRNHSRPNELIVGKIDDGVAGAVGRMARRDEGAYSSAICNRGATKPAVEPRRKTVVEDSQDTLVKWTLTSSTHPQSSTLVSAVAFNRCSPDSAAFTLGLLNDARQRSWLTDDACLEKTRLLQSKGFRIPKPDANQTFAEYLTAIE